MEKMTPFINITLSILFLCCLFDMPYGYYQLVRVAALIGFTILALIEFRKQKTVLAILLLGLACLFQPFFKVALGRQLWNIVDVIVSIALIFWTINVSTKRKKDESEN